MDTAWGEDIDGEAVGLVTAQALGLVCSFCRWTKVAVGHRFTMHALMVVIQGMSASIHWDGTSGGFSLGRRY